MQNHSPSENQSNLTHAHSSQGQRWLLPALRVILPLGLAYALIAFEPFLGALAHERPGVVPVAMVGLVIGLISPSARHWLIITLCFGVSLLAVRDSLAFKMLPAQLAYPWFEQVYPFGWGLLALLGAFAGIGEAVQPGSLWSRRCYFSAAAVYFLGHGVISFIKTTNWQSIVMMLVGCVSIYGIFHAGDVIEAEQEAEAPDEDIVEMEHERERRTVALAGREWRES